MAGSAACGSGPQAPRSGAAWSDSGAVWSDSGAMLLCMLFPTGSRPLVGLWSRHSYPWVPRHSWVPVLVLIQLSDVIKTQLK